MDYRQRIKDALERHHQRVEKKNQKSQKRKNKKNQKPEKELVEKPCVEWLKNMGFRYKIIEAKATWSHERGCYYSSAVKAGTLDCHFTDKNGFSCWVEFKAPGKIRTVLRNRRQYQTLVEEIEAGCFAVVVDSVELLKSLYEQWLSIRMIEGLDASIAFLKNNLPQAAGGQTQVADWDDEIGF